MNPDDVKVLVSYRINQAQAALNDAKVLLDSDCTPASIINRSYYAMFYSALAALQTVGKTPSKHAGALSLFNQEFVLTGSISRQCGRYIYRAFELRQSADYGIMPPVDIKAAKDVLIQASEFVNVVKNYLITQGWHKE
jgi:uncharacterized protein (UPF0332 family)